MIDPGPYESGPMGMQLRWAGRVLLRGLIWLGFGYWPLLPFYDEADEEELPPGQGLFSRWP